MNFISGHTLPNIGKRIKWQIVTLVGGLALAMSAATMSGVFERVETPDGTTGDQPPARAGSAPIATPQNMPVGSDLVYYVVDSQAQARILASAISTDAASFTDHSVSRTTSVVVVLDTPEQQAEFDAMLPMAVAELMPEDIYVQVIDLRD